MQPSPPGGEADGASSRLPLAAVARVGRVHAVVQLFPVDHHHVLGLQLDVPGPWRIVGPGAVVGHPLELLAPHPARLLDLSCADEATTGEPGRLVVTGVVLGARAGLALTLRVQVCDALGWDPPRQARLVLAASPAGVTVPAQRAVPPF